MARKTRRRQSRTKKSGASVTRRDLHVAIDAIEIARGFDGFLRGKPEPAVLVSIYGQERAPSGAWSETRLVGRTLVRCAVEREIPCRCDVPADASIRARVSVPVRLFVLVTAFEEDGGDDVTAAYARAGELRSVSVWAKGSDIPNPYTIADVFSHDGWSEEMTPVRQLVDGKDLGDGCTHDDYVGSVAARLEVTGAVERVFRAHTVSDDGSNDWTTLFRLMSR